MFSWKLSNSGHVRSSQGWSLSVTANQLLEQKCMSGIRRSLNGLCWFCFRLKPIFDSAASKVLLALKVVKSDSKIKFRQPKSLTHSDVLYTFINEEPTLLWSLSVKANYQTYTLAQWDIFLASVYKLHLSA